MKREKWDQAGKRRTMIYTDQHGRDWTAVKDILTDAPIGGLTPMGWTPVRWRGQDLLPPPHVMVFNDTRPSNFEIDYDRWRNDALSALAEWMSQATNYAAGMYGSKASEALADPPPELMRVLGVQPIHVDLIDAQAEGNKWILGLAPTRPKWADEYFKNEPVMGEARRRFADDDEEVVMAGSPRVRDEKGRFLGAEEE